MKIPLATIILLLTFPFSTSTAGSIDSLLQQAENGSIEAQLNAGDAYRYGQGVKKDLAKAFQWFLKAAESGNPVAQVRVGYLLEKGLGVKKNLDQAANWYKKSAEQGYADGQRAYGVMLELGLGVKKNPAEAAAWYRKAADQGLARAQANLGILYETGVGVEQDFDKAVYWYREATKQDYARGQTLLGRMYEQGLGVAQDSQQAMEWYRKAAAQDYAKASTFLEDLEKQQGKSPGRQPAPPTTFGKQADLATIEQAAADGEAEAQNYLGLLYLSGNQVRHDPAEAFRWFQLAADQGSIDAQNNLALMYLNGQGTKKDTAKAIGWLEKTAALGNIAAQNNLGHIYFDGRSVAIDYSKAAFWLEKAVAQNHAPAQTTLAGMYLAGQGVAVDRDKAISLLQAASNQGDENAAAQLRQLEQEQPIENNRTAQETSPANSAVEMTLSAMEYFYSGNDYAKNGLYARAITEYQRAIELDRFNANTHENLAIAYAKIGATLNAIEAMENAVRLAPDDAMKVATLGIILHVNHEPERALGYYRQAIRLNPGLREIYYNMAILYIDMMEFRLAWKAATLAQALGHPENDVFQELLRVAPDQTLSSQQSADRRVHLRRIVVDSRTKAEEVLNRLDAGEDFTVIANNFSTAPFHINGGHLGPIEQIELPAETAEALAALPLFEFSPFNESPAGFQLFQKILVFDDLLEPAAPRPAE